ncbi:hypothetical protein D3C78_921880 [compost metagenome]
MRTLHRKLERQRIDRRDHVAFLDQIGHIDIAGDDPTENTKTEIGLNTRFHRAGQPQRIGGLLFHDDGKYRTRRLGGGFLLLLAGGDRNRHSHQKQASVYTGHYCACPFS